MSVHKGFLTATNLMGINFGTLSMSPLIISAFILLMHIWEIFIVIIVPAFFEKEDLTHFVYIFCSFFQEQIPYFIQLLILYRTFRMRKLQKKLSNKLSVKFTQKLHKNEKRFLLRVGLVVLVRVLKFYFGQKRSYYFYNSRVSIFELVYTSNDFLFVYYVEMLNEYLEHIDFKTQMLRSPGGLHQIRRDLVEVFWIKRDLEKRYSLDLCATIGYNFILNILSFYWVLVRIIFNHLKNVSGWATFLHFIIPIFTYWTLFSSCEKFTDMV